MSSLTIRNLDDRVKLRLRTRAAASGRSMEEEARIALAEYVEDAPAGNIYDLLRRRFEPVLGAEFPRLRGSMRALPDIIKE